MKDVVSKTAFRYAILTGLWILAFDLMADILFGGRSLLLVFHVGLALLTVFLFYAVLRRELAARQQVDFVDQPERGITYWDWTLVPVMNSPGQVQGLVRCNRA